MIGPVDPIPAPMDNGAAPPPPSDAPPADGSRTTAAQAGGEQPGGPPLAAEPILCGHCGRTASNGISCIGMCVADSGY